MESALCKTRVYHSRKTPTAHAFQTTVCFEYLDLEELPTLFRGRWLWSAGRFNLNWFKRSDYLGDPNKPLAEEVLGRVEAKLGFRPTGNVRLLTQMRRFGFVFNPVSFYFCFGSGGELEAIVAEITNTPWREKHAYVIDARETIPGEFVTARFAKQFHVSPFFDMNQEYEWRFAIRGDSIEVHMQNWEGGEVVFSSGMVGRKVPIRSRSLAWSTACYPFQTFRIPLSIYWHAARLWMKRVPFFVHPSKRPAVTPEA